MHSSAPLRPVRGMRWWALRGAAVLAALVVGSVALGAMVGDDDRRGEVVRVVDGDTLIALVDGEETTIRLLNIDTPETKDPDEPVQCLGPEAAEFLTERLPAGTLIDLDYDEERLDRYDRTLAAVYESESLINAEIAAAGLGVPVYFAPNDRFLPEVEEAARSAQEEGRGLYSPEIECTLPAQVQVQSAAADAVPATVDGDPADALAAASTAVEDSDALITGLAAPGLPGLGNAVMASPRIGSFLEDQRGDATEVRERAVSAQETLEELKIEYDEEQERLEQERLEKERLERERKEREEQQRKEEEERQERERQERQEREEREERERQEREQRSAPAAPAQQSSGSKSSSGSATSGGGSSPSGSSGSSGSSGGSSSSGSSGSSSGGSSGSSCVPYGPEIPYSDAGGYTGKRYGMPGGKTFRKCS
ncbi:MAG: thermonuclease family protein [Brachybacterium sp.]|nr:thermonuclease family protein [Brachybacterium sp.]